MLLIKNPRIFHNIAIDLLNARQNALNAILFSLNNKSPCMRDFFISSAAVRLLSLISSRSNYEKPRS